MKKYAHFLKAILPNINEVIQMDDGALYITFNNQKDQVCMDSKDYESAVNQSKRIEGVINRIRSGFVCY